MANFCTQANALFRKNLTYHKRHARSHLKVILFPAILFVLLGGMQTYFNKQEREHFEADNPNGYPPLLQIPSPKFRAVATDSIQFPGLPDASCRETDSCPVTILITGSNRSFAESVAGKMFTDTPDPNSTSDVDTIANGIFGRNDGLSSPLVHVRSRCSKNSSSEVAESDVICVEGLNLWRNSSLEINTELFKGFREGNTDGKINAFLAAYDFLDTSGEQFKVIIQYNSTNVQDHNPLLLKISRSENMASNGYIRFLRGPAIKMNLEYVAEMPTPAGFQRPPDALSFINIVFFTWVILQIFPVILSSLVYERQQKLRIMMKMHGLGDGPYWVISYIYFLAISLIYMSCYFVFGVLTGLTIFNLNSYGVQCIFYFVFTNLQISFAFLLAALFSNLKTASVVAYTIVFGTGIMAFLLFQPLVNDASFPRGWLIVLELYPGFSLYRGLYELSKFAQGAFKIGTYGMYWEYLISNGNGVREVLIIMSVEWVVFLISAYYLDQVISSGTGNRRSPLFFLPCSQKKHLASFQKPSFQSQESSVQMEDNDVLREREKVEQLLNQPHPNYSAICYNLKKMYPGKDGNPNKVAVKGLSLALPRGECFGMLGPNGAGKTTFVSMMTGLLEPSSGAAYIEGLDLRTQMNEIYGSMGVCPQHDLLWETLTGREHLLFYGRLKNLKGSALSRAVEESLKSFNLFQGGVGDKAAGKYSGGMKRRLSVAISLIGDPKVVYMDEPSTGLDPASRKMLWDVVKRAKQDRAIILTTHSMDEAEYLCDRIGIFVDGNFQCLGTIDELKARYGGSYMFTVTTSPEHERDVEVLVKHLSPHAKKTYHLYGTQKFELPKDEAKISDVFLTVKLAKQKFTVQSWGLADTSLEDVFIKVATEAQ
ncbi:PREDICTED: ABC transporter A family member 7-like [Nicotiana attenuata]|uniref:Abc transporter a family member 7 n=1 Tax=Nicotiana attenuata TaxID=49451 RepID=A0A1J6HUL1_NICAT|nr:PREDICTED: ABC transporter A family member 7-like [Nicotiana attenuata]OIS96113.1 abc transporter a family member 7 [Nicotiana attenuata]